MSSQEGFTEGRCVQDKDTKKKYKVISKEEDTFAAKSSFDPLYPVPVPKQYKYKLENAKTEDSDEISGSNLKYCNFNQKIKKGSCVKESNLGPGYIVESISPYTITLKTKKEPITVKIDDEVEKYIPCLLKGGKRRTRKGKKSNKRSVKKAKKTAKRKARKSRR